METTSYLQAGAGLLIVLGLIVLVAFIARRLGFGTGGLNRLDRRLSVVESMALDPKRRVLLIKCDYTEHLVLLGPTSETVLSGRLPDRSGGAGIAEPPARAPSVSTSGPSMLTTKSQTQSRPSQPPPEQQPQSTWKHRSAEPRRREPQLGPVPPRGSK